MRKKTSNKKRKMSPKVKKLLKILAPIAFTGVLVCMILGIYVVSDVIGRVNGERIIDLDFYKQNQDQTTIIYADDEEGNPVELVKLHGEKNRVWVDMENMSEWMPKAFQALEDERFREHKGVDWFSSTFGILRSVIQDGDIRGGSTITMQLIKNLTGENGKSINRKYNEMISALNLEKNYEKDDIIEAYLNTIYLSHNCYGVQTAAETYFGKDISELNIAECASIAAITQWPAEYDPLWQPEKNKTRQELCLRKMYEQKMITKEEYDEAVAFELIFTNSENYVAKDNGKNDITSNSEIYSYYVDYVIDSVIKDLKAAGYSHYEATKMMYSGGLRIYSAVDTKIQNIVEDVYENRTNFPSERASSTKDLAQSAMTIMDYSGRVVAIVGGAGEKTENRSNNRAVSAIRQPGSSIKPLSIYTAAIEEDYATWSSKIKNYGITWKGKRWPDNYGGNPGDPNSYVTTQYALSISYNTVPAQLLMMMGFKTSYSYLTEKFHISTMNDKIDSTAPSTLATGGSNGGCTTLEMAAAFAAFGNGGKYYEPYCYTKVTDSTGQNILLQKNPEGEQIISPETAYVMNQMLRTVMQGPVGTGRAYNVKGFTSFAKSGTTTNNYDRWMVAGTPYYISAVWFGYDQNKQVNVSSNPAGMIYKTVMDRVHKNLASKNFEKYTDKVTQRSYCTVSGLLAGDGCTSTASGWYKTSNLPAKCAGCVDPGGNGTTTLPPESTTSVTPQNPTETTTQTPPETTTQVPVTPETPVVEPAA